VDYIKELHTINAKERCRPMIVSLFRNAFCTHLAGRKGAGAVCISFMLFESFQTEKDRKEEEKMVLFYVEVFSHKTTEALLHSFLSIDKSRLPFLFSPTIPTLTWSVQKLLA
jgi:hypothetical protein